VLLQSVATKLGPSENLLISSFSLATVISMALASAKEKTAIQLKNNLQLTNFTDEKIYATITNLVQIVKVYYHTFLKKNLQTKIPNVYILLYLHKRIG